MTKNQPHMRNTIHILPQCNAQRSGGRRQKVVHGKDQPPYNMGRRMWLCLNRSRPWLDTKQVHQALPWIPHLHHGDVGFHNEQGNGDTEGPEAAPGGLPPAPRPPPPPPQARRTTTHSSGISYDLQTTEEPQSKERTGALAHSNT